jgi:hypothetical protein
MSMRANVAFGPALHVRPVAAFVLAVRPRGDRWLPGEPVSYFQTVAS